MTSIQQLNDQIQQQAAFIRPLVAEIGKVIIGQERLIERLLIALLTNGHVLIEGVPGLAKTLTVRSLAAALDLSFQRIQFTPDLLPADLTGTQIYNPRTGEFTPRKGPIFSNVILADEINRAPAKVQSALLEAMEERQVTLGDTTYLLDEPFMVLATQNPLEQEGTYPLPEAQLDRFMLKVLVDYPSRAEERLIIERMTGQIPAEPEPVIGQAGIQSARIAVQDQIYVDDKIKEYVLDLIIATRQPDEYGFKGLSPLIDYGASPRASINLIKAAKALAFLRGRGYVTPDDIKQIAPDVMRHRIGLTFEAEAENITASQIIQQILNRVQVP
jgi:MoxR-like ATPase